MADQKAKEKLNNGIYFFRKKINPVESLIKPSDIHFIKGDFGRIIFDQQSENIIGTDGNYIYLIDISKFSPHNSDSYFVKKASVVDLQVPVDKQMFYLQKS